jgi:predicted dehydrogenase
MKELRIGCWGVAGHNIIGKMPKLKRARMTAIGGVPENVLADLRKNLPQVMADARHCADLDTMLAADVDMVVFCSDYRARQAGQAVRALRAGKHVLVEKPMATTWQDFEALERAVAESGRQLRTMNPMIYDPEFKGMKDVVDSGKVGTIVQTYALKSYPYSDGRPQDRGVDGGLLMQAGIHAVSFVRYVTGLEFEEVFAYETLRGNPKPGQLQLGGAMSFQMNDGSLCAILVNYCKPRGLPYHGNDQLRIFGTKGMIELVDGKTRRMLVTNEEKAVEFPNGTPAFEYPQDYIDSILDGTPTLLTQADSFMNTRVVLRAQESATTGKVLRI